MSLEQIPREPLALEPIQDRDHTVGVFNSLIETTLDSADGYQKAAELARNPRFKSLFQERAQARLGLTKTLKDEVRALGGETPDDGTILGQAHRVFVALRDKMSGQSDKALVEEVERGEKFIRDRFEKAAQDDALPAQAHQLIARASDAIAADHIEMIALKDEFH